MKIRDHMQRLLASLPDTLKMARDCHKTHVKAAAMLYKVGRDLQDIRALLPT